MVSFEQNTRAYRNILAKPQIKNLRFGNFKLGCMDLL